VDLKAFFFKTLYHWTYSYDCLHILVFMIFLFLFIVVVVVVVVLIRCFSCILFVYLGCAFLLFNDFNYL